VKLSLNRLAILSTFAALAALGVAYFVQDVLVIAPCPLCLLERWPYRIVIALGLLGFLLPATATRFFLSVAVLVLLAGAAIAFVHTGVEFHWWPSPLPECNAVFTPGAPLPLTPAKPCDNPTFLIPFLPVSMAALNMIYATAFALTLGAYIWSNRKQVK
jgi:disulfide bond formation protein DsbB